MGTDAGMRITFFVLSNWDDGMILSNSELVLYANCIYGAAGTGEVVVTQRSLHHSK